MTQLQSDNLFSVLLESLREFRNQIKGQSRDLVAAIGHSEDMIPQLVREVLTGVGESLDWLQTAVIALEKHVMAADAALAAIEVMGDVIEPVTREFSFAQLSTALNMPTGPADSLDKAIGSSQIAFESASIIGGMLPSPEDLTAIKEELTKLLESREADSGSFSRLLSEIGA